MFFRPRPFLVKWCFQLGGMRNLSLSPSPNRNHNPSLNLSPKHSLNLNRNLNPNLVPNPSLNLNFNPNLSPNPREALVRL